MSLGIAARLSGVDVHDSDRPALGWAFVMFFVVLASYYTLRPLRESVGTNLPAGELAHVFTWVFLVMIFLVPAFGFLATAMPLRRVLPIVYGFLVLNLAAFSLLMRSGQTPAVAWTFFIWVSVYNLFVVSLFWSLMTRCWSSEKGKQFFGIIATGGTLGSIAGSLIAQHAIAWLGAADLPLISGAFLLLALFASLRLEALVGVKVPSVERVPPVTFSALIGGATSIVLNPYLGRIAIFILLANFVSTFFYLEQARLVQGAINRGQEQVAFFASRDLMVSLATAGLQMFGTARILGRLGLTVALAALPVLSVVGLVAIGVMPTLEIVAAVMVAERIIAFGLAGPAVRVLYTVVNPDEKYKAQNFIDTVVYRGGDAAAGHLFGVFGTTLGPATRILPLVLLPLASLWLLLSLGLGRAQREQAAQSYDQK